MASLLTANRTEPRSILISGTSQGTGTIIGGVTPGQGTVASEMQVETQSSNGKLPPGAIPSGPNQNISVAPPKVLPSSSGTLPPGAISSGPQQNISVAPPKVLPSSSGTLPSGVAPSAPIAQLKIIEIGTGKVVQPGYEPTSYPAFYWMQPGISKTTAPPVAGLAQPQFIQEQQISDFQKQIQAQGLPKGTITAEYGYTGQLQRLSYQGGGIREAAPSGISTLKAPADYAAFINKDVKQDFPPAPKPYIDIYSLERPRIAPTTRFASPSTPYEGIPITGNILKDVGKGGAFYGDLSASMRYQFESAAYGIEKSRVLTEPEKLVLKQPVYAAKGFVTTATDVGAVVGKGSFQFGKDIGSGKIREYPAIAVETVKTVGTAIITQPQIVTEFIGAQVKYAAEQPAEFVGGVYAFEGGLQIAKAGYTGIKFLGAEKISAPKIVEPKVLSGSSRFPLYEPYTQQEIAKVFKTQFKGGQYLEAIGIEEGGIHATPRFFNPFQTKIPVIIGTSETPGLYVAPSTSIHFLKLSSEPTELSLKDYLKSLIPGMPKSPRIISVATGVERLPKSIRPEFGSGKAGFLKANKFFGDFEGKAMPLGKPGVAYISPASEAGIKPEKEAIIQAGSILKQVREGGALSKIRGFSKYTVVEGERVPIFRYVPTGEIGAVSKGFSRGISGYSSLSYVKPQISYSEISSIVSRMSYPYSQAEYKPSISKYKPSVSKYVPSISRSFIASYSEGKPSIGKESYKKYVDYSSGVSPSKSSLAIAPSVSVGPSIVSPSKPVYTGVSTAQGYPYPAPYTLLPPGPLKKRKEEYSIFKKKVKGFIPLIRRKGKMVPVSREVLPEQLAYKRAAEKALTTLSRTIGVKPMGETEMEDISKSPLLASFRQKAAKSKIKDYPVYVQKTETLLKTSGEKAEIRQARNLKRLFGRK